MGRGRDGTGWGGEDGKGRGREGRGRKGEGMGGDEIPPFTPPQSIFWIRPCYLSLVACACSDVTMYRNFARLGNERNK